MFKMLLCCTSAGIAGCSKHLAGVKGLKHCHCIYALLLAWPLLQTLGHTVPPTENNNPSEVHLFMAQGDNAALMTEIDNTSEAYEAMQSSNTGLVRQLGERDARISQLTGEQLRHDQAMARGKADRELAETASKSAQQHKQGLEKHVQELQSDLQVLPLSWVLVWQSMLPSKSVSRTQKATT